jgi:hypothetical protein
MRVFNKLSIEIKNTSNNFKKFKAFLEYSYVLYYG